MNKDGSYTGYDNEENMKLFVEFLSFVEDMYEYYDGGWHDNSTAKMVEKKDMYWAFMKTKVKKGN